MMPKFLAGVFVLLQLFLLQAVAFAGEITLDTRVTVIKRQLEVELHVEVHNRGNESALGLSPTATVLEEVLTFEAKDVPPQQRIVYKAKKEIPALENVVPGSYPVRLELRYKDVDNSTYSVPGFGELRTHDVPYEPQLKIVVPSIGVRDRQAITLTLTNEAWTPQEVTVSLFASSDLSIAPQRKKVTIEARAEQPIEFELINRSARAGAVLPLIAFAETDRAEVHHVKVQTGSVSVLEKPSTPVDQTAVSGYQNMLLSGGIAIFGGLLLLTLLLRRGGGA